MNHIITVVESDMSSLFWSWTSDVDNTAYFVYTLHTEDQFVSWGHSDFSSEFFTMFEDLRDVEQPLHSTINCKIFFPFLGACAKLRKATITMSVRPSVSPHETTRLPQDGFLWNLILEFFSKNHWENSSIIKIWQE